MPNYQERAITGTEYRRASGIEFDNPIVGDRILRVREEIVRTIDGEDARTFSEYLSMNLSVLPGSTTFDVLNPSDNSVVGTVTLTQLYRILYSLYWHLAQERDNP